MPVAAIATTLHNWHHETAAEAAKEIMSQVGDLSNIEIFGSQVLIAPYIRPTRTKSGLHVPTAVAKDDTWQGKVGLVLKIGPTAFDPDNLKQFGGRAPAVGEWVFHDVKACFQLHVKGDGAKRGAMRDEDGWPGRLVYAADIYGRLTALTTVV